jgi:aminoglycoside 2'-N-acetyltransferase I
MDTELRIEVIKGQNLSGEERKNIITLCSQAFEENLEAVFNTFSRPSHILGFQAGKLVSHALWVTRRLQIDNNQMLRTAYVEAVATENPYRGLGYASTIMKRVVEEIQDYELGALSPFNVAFYERLGWELWRGPLRIRTETGLVRSPGEEEVMIFRLPKTPELDLNSPLSAEWREGDLW